MDQRKFIASRLPLLLVGWFPYLCRFRILAGSHKSAACADLKRFRQPQIPEAIDTYKAEIRESGATTFICLATATCYVNTSLVELRISYVRNASRQMSQPGIRLS